VPSGAQFCDVIFILLGSKFPIVLRTRHPGQEDKDEDGGKEFEVVGPCCVPDLNVWVGY
jgi:hypothetical protein